MRGYCFTNQCLPESVKIYKRQIEKIDAEMSKILRFKKKVHKKEEENKNNLNR